MLTKAQKTRIRILKAIAKGKKPITQKTEKSILEISKNDYEQNILKYLKR